MYTKSKQFHNHGRASQDEPLFTVCHACDGKSASSTQTNKSISDKARDSSGQHLAVDITPKQKQSKIGALELSSLPRLFLVSHSASAGDEAGTCSQSHHFCACSHGAVLKHTLLLLPLLHSRHHRSRRRAILSCKAHVPTWTIHVGFRRCVHFSLQASTDLSQIMRILS